MFPGPRYQTQLGEGLVSRVELLLVSKERRHVLLFPPGSLVHKCHLFLLICLFVFKLIKLSGVFLELRGPVQFQSCDLPKAAGPSALEFYVLSGATEAEVRGIT